MINKILNKFSEENKVELEKVELALVQDLIADAGTAQKRLSSLSNLAARRAIDYKKIQDMANKVGVNLDSKTIQAGKFFLDIDKKLKNY